MFFRSVIGMISTSMIVVLSLLPANARSDFVTVQDYHMLGLIHLHCDLGYVDDLAAVLAQTYADADLSLEQSEVDRALSEAEKLISESIRLNQKDNLCRVGKASLNRLSYKWFKWVSGIEE